MQFQRCGIRQIVNFCLKQDKHWIENSPRPGRTNLYGRRYPRNCRRKVVRSLGNNVKINSNPLKGSTGQQWTTTARVAMTEKNVLSLIFGFKAASRPKFTIGSIQGESQQSSSDEQIPVVAPSKIKPKRKSSQVTEWLQSYEERQVDLQREKMEMQRDMHKEKMSMMEKLLNAIEKKNT